MNIESRDKEEEHVTERDMFENVYWSSCKAGVIVVML